jgi:hypothetical protein
LHSWFRFEFGTARRRGPQRAPLLRLLGWERWQSHGQSQSPDRQRLFLQGTALALAAAILATPVYLLLVHSPRFAHAQIAGLLILLVLAAMGVGGVGKLVRCLVAAPLDLLTAASFGVLLIVFVLLACVVVLVFVAQKPG